MDWAFLIVGSVITAYALASITINFLGALAAESDYDFTPLAVLFSFGVTFIIIGIRL